MTEVSSAGAFTVVTGRAMSCDVRVVMSGADAPRLAVTALARVEALERRWSRFLSDSEITRLNDAGGRALPACDDTIRLVEAMVAAWRATSGAFDPTLLPPLVELGYAASRDDATRRTSLAAGVSGRGRADAIRIDRERGTVRLPLGTAVDPGGLGKGLAADIVGEEALASGAESVMVEIGGDLRVAGGPIEGGWPIDVEDPRPGVGHRRVYVVDGGVATSTVRRRTWRHAGESRHHLLDPGTGRPTDGTVVSATVVAGTAAWAEAFSKVPFVVGVERSLAMLERRDLAGSVTTADGLVATSAAWSRFER